MGRDHLRLRRQKDIIRDALRAEEGAGRGPGLHRLKPRGRVVIQEGAMISAESDICQAALQGHLFFFFPFPFFFPLRRRLPLSTLSLQRLKYI